MKSIWKRIWNVLHGAVGRWILAFIILIIVLYLYTLPWTGFGDYTTPAGDFVHGKTLWDWMQLLIVPSVLAIGAYYLNSSERKNEREIATDRQQEAALQAYLDRMTELLLEKKLLTTKSKEVHNVARIRTRTILRGLDPLRKGLVLDFLYEAGLISGKERIVDLSFTDLSGAILDGATLVGVNLQSANLSGAGLVQVNLQGANLQQTYLEGANMEATNLQGANLSGSVLRGAFLFNSNLSGANLQYADLSNAVLQYAIVTDEQIATAAFQKDIIMPDGTKHK